MLKLNLKIRMIEELIPVICEKCKKPIKDKDTGENMKLSKFWYNTDKPKYCSECFKEYGIKSGKKLSKLKPYLKIARKEFNGSHETKHILLQVKWFYILQENPYNCIKSEMRMGNFFKIGNRKKRGFKSDVYGEDKNGNIYWIEIGSVNSPQDKFKLGELLNYEKENSKFHFKHININGKEVIHNEKNGLYKKYIDSTFKC